MVVRRGLSFGESPRWRGGALWYSDFFDNDVHVLGDDGDVVVLTIDDEPSGIGWLPDGRLVVVAMSTHRILAVSDDAAVRVHADLAAFGGVRTNDMVVDASGLAYTGRWGFDIHGALATYGQDGMASAPLPSTVLVCSGLDGKSRVVADGLFFPNGMALTADGRTLLVAESVKGRITAFSRTPDGDLADRRTWADLRDDAVAPDGVALDAEGALWVANAAAPECVRVGPDGRVLERVRFRQPCFGCALGGPTGDVLFATTAPSSNPLLATKLRAGLIEAVRVQVPAPTADPAMPLMTVSGTEGIVESKAPSPAPEGRVP